MFSSGGRRRFTIRVIYCASMLIKSVFEGAFSFSNILNDSDYIESCKFYKIISISHLVFSIFKCFTCRKESILFEFL